MDHDQNQLHPNFAVPSPLYWGRNRGLRQPLGNRGGSYQHHVPNFAYPRVPFQSPNQQRPQLNRSQGGQNHHRGGGQSQSMGACRGQSISKRYRGGGQYSSRGRGGNSKNWRGGHQPPNLQPIIRKDVNSKTNFYCCACDRGFPTGEELDSHKLEHITCGLDGCKFEAHALVVTKHIQMQHTNGLYERIKDLNTPEDILRWKEERRSKYPTLENLQNKKGARKEMEERREVFQQGGAHQEKIFRYKIPPDYDKRRENEYLWMERTLRQMEYKQGDAWRTRMFAPDLKSAPHRRVPFASMNKSPIVTLEAFYFNVKMGNDGQLQKVNKAKWKGFKAKTLERLPDSDSEKGDGMELSISSSEGEEDDVNCPNRETKRSQISSHPKLISLSSLVNYSSGSESETESTNNTNCEEECIPSSPENNMVIEEFDDSPSNNNLPVPLAKMRGGVTRKRRTDHFRSNMRTKLLERLLQDPIRKERNIILQACRFLCENNFFMDDKNKTEAVPPEANDGGDKIRHLTD